MPQQGIYFVVAVVVVFLGFFMFGLSENIRGPAIPLIQADFRLTEWQIGLLLAINSFGYLVACLYTAALTRFIGIRWTIVLAFGSMVVSGVCIALSHQYATFVASYVLMYLGNGMLEIGLGILAAKLFVHRAATWMNVSHFFYGVSSIIAPLVAVTLIGWPVNSGSLAFTSGVGLADDALQAGGMMQALGWRGMYAVVLASSLVPLLITFFLHSTQISRSQGNEESASHRHTHKLPWRKDKTLWLLIAVLSLGVSAEMAVGGWLVITVNKAYGIPLAASAQYLMVFFIVFTLARLLLGPLIDRCGWLRSIAIGAAWAGVTTGIGLVMGALGWQGGAWWLALAGLGIAPLYPTMMALLAKQYQDRIEEMLTVVLTIMGIAIVVGSLLVGWATDWAVRSTWQGSGYLVGYAVIALFCLVSAILAWVLHGRLSARSVKM